MRFVVLVLKELNDDNLFDVTKHSFAIWEGERRSPLQTFCIKLTFIFYNIYLFHSMGLALVAKTVIDILIWQFDMILVIVHCTLAFSKRTSINVGQQEKNSLSRSRTTDWSCCLVCATHHCDSPCSPKPDLEPFEEEYRRKWNPHESSSLKLMPLSIYTWKTKSRLCPVSKSS
jgi:hypothetical protein